MAAVAAASMNRGLPRPFLAGTEPFRFPGEPEADTRTHREIV